MELNRDRVERLVHEYMDYWDQEDTDGLMSMYHPDMLYHDMQSGETVDYSNVMQFLLDTFAHKSDRHLKLKKIVIPEESSAFIYWHHSFFATNEGKKVDIHGVELMVFRDDKIISIHEFYDFRSSESEPVPTAGKGTHEEKMSKLGLSENMMTKLANELLDFFDREHPYLQPDLTLAKVSTDLGYTRNQISFVINHGMHRTFYDLVNERRIDHAIRQMSLPDNSMSILELGLDAGFSSVSGFYNAFRKQTDMTPAQYKRSL